MSEIASGWYVARNGQQTGPLPYAQLHAMAHDGRLAAGDLVWTDGQAEWQPAGDLPGLFPAAALAYQPGVLNYNNADFGTQYAGFGRRFVAYLIDYVLTYVAGLVLGLGIGASVGVLARNKDPQLAQLIAQVAASVIGLVMTWLYFALMESSMLQASLGKMALGVKVTDLNGNRIRFGRATGRHFAKILSGLILGIGFLMILWTPKRQGLHDQLAGTHVIRK